eukprot:Sspe_Gene.69300::Locus_40852_Transcript_1_4_Confidence_0.286_Length_397::g.69300::m.69300
MRKYLINLSLLAIWSYVSVVHNSPPPPIDAGRRALSRNDSTIPAPILKFPEAEEIDIAFTQTAYRDDSEVDLFYHLKTTAGEQDLAKELIQRNAPFPPNMSLEAVQEAIYSLARGRWVD